MSINKNSTYHRNYKYHYIYKITCLCGNLKGHYYIGKHSTTKSDPMDDGYNGGGVIINKYYQKYPPKIGVTIDKEIIELNDDIETNSKREKEIIGDLWNTDPLCLNKKKGGEGGNGYANRGKVHSKEQTENWKKYINEYYKTHCGFNTGNGTIVDCYDDDGEFVGRFCTQALAGKVFGKTSIGWALQDENRKEAGYRWRVVDSMFSPIEENIGVYEKPKRVISEESKERMRAAKIGKHQPHEWAAVIGTDKDGIEHNYESIVDAATQIHPQNIKAAQKNIQGAAKGRRKVAYGMSWRYC